MGCCGSTEKEEDQHLDNLRNEVALLVLKESPQEVILRYVAALDEAPPNLREKALSSLAFVIKILDNIE